MKCYFALAEPDEATSFYLDLLYVSLKSARLNTTLDLYALYDGSKESPAFSILQQFNVNIIEHKFSHEEFLEKTLPQEYIKSFTGYEVSYKKIAGTFMRFDIPFIEQEDDYVFYTDIDVIFLQNIKNSDLEKPSVLSAATEFDKDINKMQYFNAGILYLNVKEMQKISSAVFQMLKQEERNKTGLFDQGYLNQLCFNKMNVLPLEYNWKPYWGYNSSAKIVHLHGMKPSGNFINSAFNLHENTLYYMLNGHYEDIDGYIYYLHLYYSLLGKDGTLWTAQFISKIFTVCISEEKAQKERIISQLQNTIMQLQNTISQQQSTISQHQSTISQQQSTISQQQSTISQQQSTISQQQSDISQFKKTIKQQQSTISQLLKLLEQQHSAMEQQSIALESQYKRIARITRHKKRYKFALISISLICCLALIFFFAIYN